MRRQTRAAWVEILAGAAAGAVGSALMAPIQKAFSRLASEGAKAQEKAVSRDESPPVKVGRIALETAGVQVPESQRPRLGKAVHYLYGTGWGALYGLLRHQFPRLPRASGVVLGLGLWAIGDELLLPALDLAPPSTKYPKETHLRALAAHLAYGASVEQGVRLISRALA